MAVNLNGASAIVTGGASGLGAATAKLLSERGAAVVILDRQPQQAAELAGSIGAKFVVADHADPEQVGEAVATAAGLGPLRALVNCAGVGGMKRTLNQSGDPLDLSFFENLIRINLTGVFNCIRLAAAQMARNEPDAGGSRGAIVTTASVSAFDGMIGQVAYSASKAGIAGMTLPLARDLANVGIRVNSICPGPFDTPIYGTGEAVDAFKERFGLSAVFPPRLGQPGEFATLALEMLVNDFMNAATVRIDGGMRLPPR